MKKKNDLVWITGIVLIIVGSGLYFLTPNKEKWNESLITYGCDLSNSTDDNLENVLYCNSPFGFNHTLSLNKESDYYITIKYSSQWVTPYSLSCENSNKNKIEIIKGRWAYDVSGNPINLTLPKECYLDGKTIILFEAPDQGWLHYYRFHKL